MLLLLGVIGVEASVLVLSSVSSGLLKFTLLLLNKYIVLIPDMFILLEDK